MKTTIKFEIELDTYSWKLGNIDIENCYEENFCPIRNAIENTVKKEMQEIYDNEKPPKIKKLPVATDVKSL